MMRAAEFGETAAAVVSDDTDAVISISRWDIDVACMMMI